MNIEEVKARLRELNFEMRQQEEIAVDLDRDSDEIIKARKELNRIKHDIAYLLDKYAAV